ncbi:ribosomal L28 family-domain-containing protein [Blastocladiella britannica]|nr:ribosomal L28 family-domain-containing protein [Blastocladiella britannica]
MASILASSRTSALSTTARFLMLRSGKAANPGSRPGRADTSLLGGKRILTGNKVSHSEHKTRRSWLPNVVERSLFSRVLEQHLRLKVSAAALRTIDKKGGLDAYLLTTPDDKIDSVLGTDIKARIAEVLNEKTQGGKVPLQVTGTFSATRRA